MTFCSALLAAMPLFAQPARTPHAIAIASGSLSRALEQLGEQSGALIMYDPALVRDLGAPAVNGEMTPQAALDSLLSAHRQLTWEQLNDGTFVIKARHPAPPGPATAAGADAPRAETSATTLDSISVIGTGSTRTTAAVAQDYIQTQAPGIAPQNLLQALPGVNVQTSDPYAMYEYNNTMRVRGFAADQLGVTLDGVPVESTDFAGPITRYILSENLASVEVSPGSGDVSQPALRALGGAIRYFSRDPAQDFGGKLSQTLGSYGFTRSFFRVDTGQWWPDGPAMYLSGARTRMDSYQNSFAKLETDHFEAKIKQNWGSNSLALVYTWDDRKDHDYQNYTLAMRPAGWHINRYLTGDLTEDAYYYEYWKNGARDSTLRLNGDFQFTDALTLKFNVYYQATDGWAYYSKDYAEALAEYEDAIAANPGRTDVVAPTAGTIPVINEIIAGEKRGATAALRWEAGVHSLETGLWISDSNYRNVAPVTQVDSSTGQPLWGTTIVWEYDRHFNTKSYQLYAKDTIRLLENRLAIDLGTKALKMKRTTSGIANVYDFTYGIYTDEEKTSESDWFQPQAGVTFDATATVQLFANYAENFSASPTAAAVSQNLTDTAYKPERSRNVDIGVRASHAQWSGYLSLYGIKYIDRLQVLSAQNIQQIGRNTYVNVGDVTTYGAELSAEWLPATHWRLSGSVSLNRSTYDNGYVDPRNGDYIDIEGNDLYDQPRVNLNAMLAYDGDNVFGNLAAAYMGSRYGDQMNTQKVPGYALLNGAIGYRGSPGGRFEDMRVQLSAYNLLDKKYLARISPNISSANYKMGAPRTLYLSLEYEF